MGSCPIIKKRKIQERKRKSIPKVPKHTDNTEGEAWLNGLNKPGKKIGKSSTKSPARTPLFCSFMIPIKTTITL